MVVDAYGQLGGAWYTHLGTLQYNRSLFTLNDVSHYYSTTPDFVLGEGLPFPSIGPKANGFGIPTNTIPAKIRNTNNEPVNRTFINDLTAFPAGNLEQIYRGIFNDVTLTRVDEQREMAFIGHAPFDLPTGIYIADVYEMQVDVSFAYTFATSVFGWLDPIGFSGANPNHQEKFVDINPISYSEAVFTTYFYKNVYDETGDLVKEWWPYNPNNVTPIGHALGEGTFIPLTSSGSLTQNEEWSGTHIITGNVSVPSGLTLRIAPGTIIQVSNGSQLTINGNIDALGTSSEPITFDRSATGSWSGIEFGSTGSGTLNNCTFTHAATAITKSNTGSIDHIVSIDSCEFTNNGSNIEGYNSSYQQIHVTNSTINYASSEDCIYLNDSGAYLHGNYINGQDQSSDGICAEYNFGNQEGLTIFENNIFNCSSGIHFWDGSAIIQKNNIHSNSRGVRAFYYSAPYFYEDNTNNQMLGKNIITNNTYGIFINSTSSAYLHNSQNTISGNSSYNLLNLNYTTLDAEYNYWGADPPDESKIYHDVDYDPYLNTSATSAERISDESYTLKVTSSTRGSKIVASEQSGRDDHDPVHHALFEKAVALERAKNYHAAIAQFKKVVDYNPDHTLAVSALHHLIRSSNKEDKNATASTVQEIKNAHANSQVAAWTMKYNVGELAKSGQLQDALSLSREIVSKFSDLSVASDALYEQWVINYILIGNKAEANSITSTYEKKYGLDKNLIRMKVKSGLIDAETARELKAQLLQKRDGASKQNETQLPQEYSLSQNYPNPFNPTTTIRFALPELSTVSIKLYNISGQMVKEIVSADMQPGHHKITVEGGKFASGVYLYKLTAQGLESENSFSATKRMLLIK